MPGIRVGTQGARFTLNGERQVLLMRSAFAVMTYLDRWASGDRNSLHKVHHFLERTKACGFDGIRVFGETSGWKRGSNAFFKHYATSDKVWNYNQLRNGQRPRELTPHYQRMILKLIELLREFDMVAEFVTDATLKHDGVDAGTISHCIRVVARFFQAAEAEQDINIFHELHNEWDAHNQANLTLHELNMQFTRHRRLDDNGEPEQWPRGVVGVSHGGRNTVDYRVGRPNGTDYVALHPTREGSWWKRTNLEQRYAHLPRYYNESKLYTSPEEWDRWVQPGTFRQVACTKNLKNYLLFMRGSLENGISFCVHDTVGMQAGFDPEGGSAKETPLEKELGGIVPPPLPPGRMQVYLNAHSDPLTDGRTVQEARKIGFDGIRRGVGNFLNSDELTRAVKQMKDNPDLSWMLLVVDPEDPQYTYYAEQAAEEVARQDVTNIVFNLGTEATLRDSFKNNPEKYANVINAAAGAIWKHLPNIPIVVSTTDQTSRQRLEFVKAVVPLLHSNLAVAVHTYRTDTSPDTPADGFNSREEENAAVHDALQGRDLWNTETGWHTALRKWGLCKSLGWFGNFLTELFTGNSCQGRFTELEVGTFITREIELHKGRAKGFVVYQAYSGHTDDSEDHFGLFDVSHQPNPRLAIVKQYLNPEPPPSPEPPPDEGYKRYVHRDRVDYNVDWIEENTHIWAGVRDPQYVIVHCTWACQDVFGISCADMRDFTYEYDALIDEGKVLIRKLNTPHPTYDERCRVRKTVLKDYKERVRAANATLDVWSEKISHYPNAGAYDSLRGWCKYVNENNLGPTE